MTWGGWVVLFLSVGGVSALLGWCLYKVLSTPGETEHMHGFESHTPDADRSVGRRPRT